MPSSHNYRRKIFDQPNLINILRGSCPAGISGVAPVVMTFVGAGSIRVGSDGSSGLGITGGSGRRSLLKSG